jgi:hypothetical protein
MNQTHLGILMTMSDDGICSTFCYFVLINLWIILLVKEQWKRWQEERERERGLELDDSNL